MVYMTDNELGPGGFHDLPDDWRSGTEEFLSGVHTLIHDAMYTDALGRKRAGWGHSTAAEAVDLAASSGVRRLVLFHHEPAHDDSAVDALLERARARADRVSPGLTVEAAQEGMRLSL